MVLRSQQRLTDCTPPRPEPAAPGWLLLCPVVSAPALVVILAGEADLATAAQLEMALVEIVRQSPRDQVWLELTGLDFCDLKGLDAIYAGMAEAQRAGLRMRLFGASKQLAWLLATFPPRVQEAVPEFPPLRLVGRCSPRTRSGRR